MKLNPHRQTVQPTTPRAPQRWVNVTVTVETMMQIDEGAPTTAEVEAHINKSNWKHVSNVRVVHETYD